MKKNLNEKEKEFNKELLIGAILAIISLIFFIVCWILTYVSDFKDLSKTWYVFVILGVGIVFFIFSFLILKKGNKKRINYYEDKEKKEFEEKMKEYMKKKEKEK